jgi:ATP-binding cassette subfamily B protein
VQGLLPAASVLLVKRVVDRLVGAIGAGATWEAAAPALGAAAALGAVMLAGHAADALLRWLRVVQAERVGDHLRALIHAKAADVDYAYFETPAYYDELYRVLHESSGRPLALLDSLGELARDALTLLAMGAVLVPYGPLLPLVLLAAALPGLVVLVRYNRRYHAWWAGRTEDNRRAQYYDDVLTHSLAAAEVRMFGLGAHFRPAYAALRARLRGERERMERGQVGARLGAATLALVATGAVMAWMGWRAIRGAATLGDLALFYQAFTRGQGVLQSLLGGVGQLHEHALYLRHLFHFLDQEPTVAAPPDPRPVPARLREGIRFRGVSFAYPGTDERVLDGFDLEVPAGRIVAVVGENGAGKSTLVKLLARLYDPSEGAVELDGVDLRAFDPADLRRRIAPVFQFPVSYYATAAENVAFGDLDAEPTAERVEAAARAAGVHERVLRLPQGYATPLGKWFSGGQELSGGEWQRLALARAFFRDAAVVLLDEPTSMMDSWAEADWFDRFRAHAEGRTALVVTHRFTVARRADHVLVMHRGRIVESGTHDALLALDGRYRASWERQVAAVESGALSAEEVAAYDVWGEE